MVDKQQSLFDLELRLTSLMRTLEALNRKRKYPIERAHYLLLLQLNDAPLSIGELATQLLLDNSTVTRQINAMLKNGLIEKVPNPNDARSTLVWITLHGQQLVSEMHQLRIERLSKTLSLWEDEEIQALADLMSRFDRDMNHSIENGN